MDKKLELNLNHKNDLARVTKALSNTSRLDILILLSQESLSVDEISKRLNSPLTTVASNIQILENTGPCQDKITSWKTWNYEIMFHCL